MTLDQGVINKKYQIQKIDLPAFTKRHLEALGMTNKCEVEILNRKGKGIMMVRFRGSSFALGYNVTRKIEVKEVKAWN